MTTKTTKRILLTGDWHCGHVRGLTPPDYMSGVGAGKDKANSARQWQQTLWDLWTGIIRSFNPHVLVCNGDAVDGKGKQSGEHIISDVVEQAAMAAQCAKVAARARKLFTFGTDFHVAIDGDDVESSIAREVGGEIHSHLYLDHCGVLLDCKHHVGASGIPHGRHTAMARERLWQQLWSEYGAPKPSMYTVIVRSHVHYFNYCGGTNWLGMTLPSMQGPGTKYGMRRCSGTVNCGVVMLEITPGGTIKWQEKIIVPLVTNKAITL